MPLLVMKFGGTSVGDLDRIKNAAQKVKREVERGYDVIVIVSAAAPVGASAAAIASVSGLNRSVAINAISLSALIGLLTTSALLYLTSAVFG